MLYFGVLAGYEAATVHWYATWVDPGICRAPHSRPCPDRRRVPAVSCLPAGATAASDRQGLMPLSCWHCWSRNLSPADHSHDARRCDASARPAATATTRMVGARRASPLQIRSRAAPCVETMTLQSNPFVVALAVAIAGTSALVATDWFSVDSLRIHRIASRGCARSSMATPRTRCGEMSVRFR